MEYVDFIKTKRQNNLKIAQLREKKIHVEILEALFTDTEKYLSKFKGIENQLYQLLKDTSDSSVSSSLKLAQEFSNKAPLVDDKLIELESVSNFPTDEVQANFKNHIHLIRSNMDVQNMDFVVRKADNLMEKLYSESKRIEKELELKRLEELRLEKERQERIERERLAKIERERLEMERLEAERLAQLEAERLAKIELNKKIAKYIGIVVAIALGLWLIIGVILPFLWEHIVWVIIIAVIIIVIIGKMGD